LELSRIGRWLDIVEGCHPISIARASNRGDCKQHMKAESADRHSEWYTSEYELLRYWDDLRVRADGKNPPLSLGVRAVPRITYYGHWR